MKWFESISITTLLIILLIYPQEYLHMVLPAAGLDSPTKFEREHVVYKDERGRLFPVE